MATFDPGKFVFHETFTNNNGKQSGSGFIGVITGLIAGAAFISLIVGYFLKIPNTLEVMEIILKLFGLVTVLLGVRKVSGDYTNRKINGNGNNVNDSTTSTTKKTNVNDHSDNYSDDILEAPAPKKG